MNYTDRELYLCIEVNNVFFNTQFKLNKNGEIFSSFMKCNVTLFTKHSTATYELHFNNGEDFIRRFMLSVYKIIAEHCKNTIKEPFVTINAWRKEFNAHNTPNFELHIEHVLYTLNKKPFNEGMYQGALSEEGGVLELIEADDIDRWRDIGIIVRHIEQKLKLNKRYVLSLELLNQAFRSSIRTPEYLVGTTSKHTVMSTGKVSAFTPNGNAGTPWTMPQGMPIPIP